MRGFFRSIRFFDAINHASQVATGASQALIIAALIQEVDGYEHHFGIIRAIGDEQFSIFKSAGGIVKLLAAFH